MGASPEFMATPAPTREDLRGVIARVIARLETIARRRGQREAVDADDEDGMEGLRRAVGGHRARGHRAHPRGTTGVSTGGAADEASARRTLIGSGGP